MGVAVVGVIVVGAGQYTAGWPESSAFAFSALAEGEFLNAKSKHHELDGPELASACS